MKNILRILEVLALCVGTAFAQNQSGSVNSGGTVASPVTKLVAGTGISLSPTSGIGSVTVTATGTSGEAITDDLTTNATMFPVWVTANTGTLPLKVTSTKMFFNPSTGALASTHMLLNGLSTDGTGGLQFATHTTSAGGINLGSNIVMFTSTSNRLDIGSTAAAFTFRFMDSGTVRGQIVQNGTTLTLDSTAGSLILASNDTTAVTLDSSQNATFAGQVIPSQTIGIKGTTTNNSVSAGGVGEYIATTVASASAVSLSTATSTNLTSIALTAGDWDVDAEFIYIPGAATSVTQLSQGVSQTTGTLPTITTGAGDYSVFSEAANVPGANNISQSVGTVRVSLSGSATIFAVARPTFTVSTLTVFGTLRARRVR